MKYILLLLFVFMTSQISQAAPPSLLTGTWRGVLTTQGKELPFTFLVEKVSLYDFDVYINNGDEKLHVPNVRLKGDSVTIELPVFDSEIRGIFKDKVITGIYARKHPTGSYELPFRAEHGKLNRFPKISTEAPANFDGKWNVSFIGKDGKPAQAVGLFRQQGAHVTGTFLTPTGDYRYLEGQADGNVLRLSTFNGGFVYMFEATQLPDGTLKGEFFAGKTGYQRWIANRDEKAALPDANTITSLKEGHESLSFLFPDLEGKPVSLFQQRFKDKVVVVQLFGSWCPNCQDEIAFLAPWYVTNRKRGIEVVGLAFEYSPEYAVAKTRVERLKSKYKIEYPLLIAGASDKESRSKAMPMLENFNALPTTIIIDRKGKVRSIHSGFSGPGTGEYYQQYIEEFNNTVDTLLREK